jgi:hypothetical protein
VSVLDELAAHLIAALSAANLRISLLNLQMNELKDIANINHCLTLTRDTRRKWHEGRIKGKNSSI